MPRTAPEITAAPMTKAPSKLLLVDAERGSRRLVGDLGCEVIAARSLSEARAVLEREAVSLVVTDLKLPDGDGMELVRNLRSRNSCAEIVVTGRDVSLDDALAAIREGATDFVPKPCKAAVFTQRLKTALDRHEQAARNDRKVARLKAAVRKLSAARKTVSRKVDLLCNDLVAAYGEISKQVDTVRVGEDFRKLTEKTADLEQLLCHTMDWLMRRCGYSNIAVFLATGESFQLGAYVKYTMASSPELTEAMLQGIVAKAGREGFVRMSAEEGENELTGAELRHLRGQAAIAANCTYLGDSLATLVLFRDGASPFTAEDAETFRIIAPLVAVALASHTREPQAGEPEGEYGVGTGEEGGSQDGQTADSETPNPDKVDAADWWKRGEAPPF